MVCLMFVQLDLVQTLSAENVPYTANKANRSYLLTSSIL